MLSAEFISVRVKPNRRNFVWFLPVFFALAFFFPIASVSSEAQLIQASADAISQPGRSAVGKLKPGVEANSILNLGGVLAWQPLYPFSASGDLYRVYKITLIDSEEIFAKFLESGLFEYFVDDRLVKADAVTVNDPKFTASVLDMDKQWWLAKIQLPDAWEVGRGEKTTTVAVVDTGINGRHEDLDDGRVGSGLINYCQTMGNNGQCLVHASGQIAASQNSDDNGHGTLVAGVIGAIPNNGKGIVGVNFDVRLIPVKVLDGNGSGVSSDVAAGIVWATDNGANIINLSLGGTSLEGNQVLADAITYAFKAGVLVVAAAGNDAALVGADLDISPVYPICGDNGKNMVLGVAASDMEDRKAAFSNYGRSCIDVVAPGTAYFKSRDDQRGIISTYYDPAQPSKNNLYAFASGTSMSAPMVSGVAALLKSHHPDLSGTALRDRLIASADPVDSQNLDNCSGNTCAGKLGAGRLNALRAMQAATLVNDTLVGDPAGRVYLISDGLRRLASDFVLAQRGYEKARAKLLAASEIEALPLGQPLPPLDGTLAKTENLPVVFSVVDGLLSPASYLAFQSHNYDFSKIATLPDVEISGYRQGGNLMPADGALFKLAGQPAVYFLKGGMRRLISYFSFMNRGLKFSNVVEVEAEEFNRYPADADNSLQPPLDGTLLKGRGSAVFVVESGVLRELSAESFASRGYQFSQVHAIPQSELDGYEKGAPILLVSG